MKLFDIVPDNLFKILTGKNKEIVFECLSKIYQLCSPEATWQIEKEVVVDELKLFFENQLVFEEMTSTRRHTTPLNPVPIQSSER